jgi:hypothetical protein
MVLQSVRCSLSDQYSLSVLRLQLGLYSLSVPSLYSLLQLDPCFPLDRLQLMLLQLGLYSLSVHHVLSGL